MKLISIVMIVGLILLYFVDAFFKIQIMNWEMLTHSASGFLRVLFSLESVCFMPIRSD